MAISLVPDEQETPVLTRGVKILLGINVAILFLQWTVISDADAFAVLGFQDRSVQHTLWSTVTYMFVHYGVWHLALNMYALVMFGPRLEHLWGSRSFALFYVWCGVGGALAHLLFVRNGILVGSTAAVLGLVYAHYQQWPADEVAVFGVVPVRAWALGLVLGLGILAFGVINAAAPDAGGVRYAYLSHLGGLAFAWLYFRTPPAVGLERLRQRISPAPDFPDEAPPRAIPRTLPRARAQRDEVEEIVMKSNAIVSPPRPAQRAVVTPVRTESEARAAELNRVLDKVSSSGLGSLSTDERAVLDEIARGLRGE